MVQVDVYNVTGDKTGSLELSDDVFGVKPKASVVHQVYTAILANFRQPWAHSKNKGEVRGGGKKPWKQKGTGRARHGSIRSPLWKGGGVTFGPLNTRNYKQKINKKTNQLAVKMCLSDKVNTGKLVVLEGLPADGKTKTMSALWKKLPGAHFPTLLAVDKSDKKDEVVARASRNLSKLDLGIAKDINLVDLMNHQYVILTKAGIKIFESRLTVKK